MLGNPERNGSKEVFFPKAAIVPVKLLNKKLASSKNERTLLQNTSKELLRRSDEQKKVLSRSVSKLIERLATCFTVIRICTSSSIPKW